MVQEAPLLEFIKSPAFLEATSTGGGSKIVSRLRASIENEEHYETHQILKSIYYRLNKQPERQQVLQDLLDHGSKHLISKGESTSGQDIGQLYLKVLGKDSEAPSKKISEAARGEYYTPASDDLD